MSSFKNRALTFNPALSNLAISEQQWIDIETLFHKERRKSLNHSFLLRAISEATAISYEDTIKQLEIRQQPDRSAKPRFNQLGKDPASQPRTYPRRQHSPTSLVSDSKQLPEPLKEAGVKYKTLTPATPGRQGYLAPVRSPQSSIYRPVIDTKGHRLFQKATPPHSKAILSPSKYEAEPKNLHYERPEPIQFKATESTLRPGIKRPTAQKTLTGAPCREVFMACGDKMALSMTGNRFHWSHMIAHLLGGAASAKNLLPSTAQANYTTLHLVEEHIVDILTTKQTKEVDIEVTPHYLDASLIPSEIIFELSWQTLNADNEPEDQMEIIHINPRSHQALSHSNLDCIRTLRTLERPDDNEQDQNDNSNPSNP